MKVSIIIPVYNCEKYIDRCIESVLSQTFCDFEVLLTVGICTDNSLLKCIEWQKKDARIIIVSRKDTSLGDARNYALKMAKGEYIAYCDADDFYDKKYLEYMLKPLEQDSSIDISCCGYDRHDGKSFLEGAMPYGTGRVSMDFKKYLEILPAAAVWLKMFRREWLLDYKIEMFDGCCEDQSLHFMLAGLVQKAYLIQEPLYHYNIGNEGSLVRTLKSRMDYGRAIEYAIEYLKGRDLYECNRCYFINGVCSFYTGFLMQAGNNNKGAIAAYKQFLEKYFPEVVEEYYQSRHADKKIKNKIILYGAGADGKKFLKRDEVRLISYIVDKSPSLQGQKKNGLLVRPVQALYQERDVSVIVASSRYYYEITKDLRTHGINSIFAPQEFCDEYYWEKAFETDKKKNIILFNTPAHANIGDHLIAEAEKEFFKKYLSEYHVVEVTSNQYEKYFSVIYSQIKKDDVIAVTGGGFLGTLWMESGESTVRDIMREYSGHKIIIFPQSIFFDNTEEGREEYEKSKEIYNSCADLILFLREEESYKRAIGFMKRKEICRLIPDIVLSVSKADFNVIQKEKNGKAAICLKDCKESVFSESEKQKIINIVEKHKKICFTSMYALHPIEVEERKDRISEKMNELCGYDVVITDALHCMILCAIVGTPCVALNNISGKVKGVYQWIKDLSYIEFTENIADLENAVKKVVESKERNYGFDYMPYMKLLLDCIKGAVSV